MSHQQQEYRLSFICQQDKKNSLDFEAMYDQTQHFYGHNQNRNSYFSHLMIFQQQKDTCNNFL